MTGARDLTLSFIHWLQSDAPRPDGGTGFPELQPCGSVVGTSDGLAMRPYVREARRIKAQVTVLEQHIGVEARPGATCAEPFDDTVGVGSYRIDLHPSTAGRGYLDIATYPFQVPLGALLPQRIENLLAAGKTLGVTHITMAAIACTRSSGTPERLQVRWLRSASNDAPSPPRSAPRPDC